MTTTTDPKLRRFFERLDDAAPVAPSFERITNRDFSFTPEGPRRPVAMLLAAAACVACLLVGLGVLASTRSTSEPAASDTATAPSFVATPAAGLPFAVLPADLPQGWEIADVAGIQRDEDARPLESEFLFRDPTSGAAVLLQTTVDPEMSADDSFGSETFEADGMEAWAIDGGFVTMHVAGLSPAEATELRQALSFEVDAGEMVASLPMESRFILESSRLGSESTRTNWVWALVVITTPNGSATINLSTRPVVDVFDHFGVPVEVDGVTVYQSRTEVRRDPIPQIDTGAGSESRQGERVSAWVEVDDPSDIEDATAVAAQLEAVSFEQWDEQEDRVADELSQLPIIRTLSFNGVEVTEHRSGDRTALCADWTESVRCRLVAGGTWPVSLVVNDLWIAVGQIDTGTPATEFTVNGDQGETIGRWEPTDNGAFVAYAFPNATAADWKVGTADGPNQDGQLRRPSH